MVLSSAGPSSPRRQVGGRPGGAGGACARALLGASAPRGACARALLRASVPGSGVPPAPHRSMLRPTGCSRHPPCNASRAVRNGVSWVLVTTLPLTAYFIPLLQWHGCGCWGGEAWQHSQDTVSFGRVSRLCCLTSHTCSALLFHSRMTIFGRKVGLLPQTEPGVYRFRPTGHLIWESLSASGQAWVLPKNALSLPGVAQHYPMESVGKTVT